MYISQTNLDKFGWHCCVAVQFTEKASYHKAVLQPYPPPSLSKANFCKMENYEIRNAALRCCIAIIHLASQNLYGHNVSL